MLKIDKVTMIDGIRVVISDQATMDGGQAKVYPKRKAKNEAHWRRMNHKWLKRYGTKRKACMYALGQHTVVCHPTLWPELRAAMVRHEQ